MTSMEDVKREQRGYALAEFFATKLVDVVLRYHLRFGSGDELEDLLYVVERAYRRVVPESPVERPRVPRQRRQKPPSSARTLALLKVPCVRCGSTDRVVLDHITPQVRGGRYVEGNVQPLCTPCNSRKAGR